MSAVSGRGVGAVRDPGSVSQQEQLSLWVPDADHPRAGRGLEALAERLASDADLVARYRAKVWTAGGPDTCHIWLGALNGRTGHAKIHIGYETPGGKAWVDYGHRIAWVLGGGDLSPGLLVRHDCDEPPCQNFNCLTPGSVWDNSQDWASRRHRRTGPLADPRGIAQRARALQAAILGAGDDPAAQVAAYRAAADAGQVLSGQIPLITDQGTADL